MHLRVTANDVKYGLMFSNLALIVCLLCSGATKLGAKNLGWWNGDLGPDWARALAYLLMFAFLMLIAIAYIQKDEATLIGSGVITLSVGLMAGHALPNPLDYLWVLGICGVVLCLIALDIDRQAAKVKPITSSDETAEKPEAAVVTYDLQLFNEGIMSAGIPFAEPRRKAG